MRATQQIQRLTADPAAEADVKSQPHGAAVLASAAGLERVRGDAPGEQLAPQPRMALDLLGRGEVRKREGRNLIARMTRQRAPRLVGGDETTVECGVGEADGALLERHPVALLALPELSH